MRNFLDSLVNNVTQADGGNVVERLCRQRGWSIDGREGDRYRLDFNGDGITPRRSIYLVHKRGGAAVIFLARCRYYAPVHRLPDGLATGLLARNEDLNLGAWYVSSDEDGDAHFWLRYWGLSGGLTAEIFGTICSDLIGEVAKVEASLHTKGLL